MIPPGALDLLLPQPNTADLAFRWATVTSTSPLRVRLDGEDAPLPLDLDSLVDPAGLRVGDRVRVELGRRRIIIHGASGLGGVARAVELGANVNLNDIGAPGTYIQKANVNTSLALNYPIAEAGLLEVFSASNSVTENMLHQRYTRYGGTNGKAAQVWVRRYYASGGTPGWGSWVLVGAETPDGEVAVPITALGASITMYLYRQGIHVNAVINSIANFTSAGELVNSTGGLVPARYRPYFPTPFSLLRNTGATAANPFLIYINTNGQIQITCTQTGNYRHQGSASWIVQAAAQ